MQAVRKRVVALSSLVLSLALAAAAPAQQAPPAMGGMPQIPKVELSEDSAKRAIDTYLTLREKYGDKIPPADKTQALNQGLKSAADINAVVAANGFKDATEWQQTLANVALAYGFQKEGQGGDIDAKIEEMKTNPQIPANIRDQMIQMMTSLRPSENNAKVVKALTADPAYAAKLAEIAK